MRRRSFLQTALLAWPAAATPPGVRALYAYVGCYTTELRHGRGAGIHVYRVHPETGELTHVQLLDGLVNPSFLIANPAANFVYSVHGDQHYATAFSVDPATGRLSVINQADTGGANGVHQALSNHGRFLVVANYGSGTVAVLPVREDGRLEDQIQLVPLEGTPGPNRVEQAASHPHHIVFDPTGHFVLVPDKGLDRVFVFRFDPATGHLTPASSLETRSAAGPRHLAFHPKLPIVWIVNELNSSITTCAWDDQTGTLKPLQILPTLPPEFTGNSTAAEIAVSANAHFVYASNRGHDSIAAFRVHPGTGLLAPAGWTPARGKVPRSIGFEPGGRFLYSTNEQGDTVTAFRMAPETGRLAPAGPPIPNLSAVTITFKNF